MEQVKLEKGTIGSILEKLKKAHPKDFRIVNFSWVYDRLSVREAAYLRAFFSQNPAKFGFKGPRYGIARVPKRLVKIKNRKGKSFQYLPEQVFRAYRKMDRAMKQDLGRGIYIGSGYRSAAYQAYLFLYNLSCNKFNLKRVGERVAFPAYSEHGYPKTQAIDFETQEGSPWSDGPFQKTVEYKWLRKHAGEYGFELSYPKKNAHGVMFEPWHWRYTGIHGGSKNKNN